MIQVANSSSILAYDYDKLRSRLVVQYKNADPTKRSLYEYSNVTEEEYKLMCINTSVGKATKERVWYKEGWNRFNESRIE